MAGTAKRFRDKIAYRSGFCLWRDESPSVRGSWQTTRSCGLAASEAGTPVSVRYFGAASRSREYGDSVCPSVAVARPTEAIRPHMRASFFCHGRNLFVSIQRNPFSSKKKPTCRATSDETPLRLSPTILNFRYGRLVNWLLHTRRHSPISEDVLLSAAILKTDKITGVSVIAGYSSHRFHMLCDCMCVIKKQIK